MYAARNTKCEERKVSKGKLSAIFLSFFIISVVCFGNHCHKLFIRVELWV